MKALALIVALFSVSDNEALYEQGLDDMHWVTSVLVNEQGSGGWLFGRRSRYRDEVGISTSTVFGRDLPDGAMVVFETENVVKVVEDNPIMKVYVSSIVADGIVYDRRPGQ